MASGSGRAGRIVKGLRITGIILAAVIAVGLAWGLLGRPSGERTTPAGWRRHTAHYVTMRDGVDIAVDVWLPADLAAGARAPALIDATRYWRTLRTGFASRLLMGWGLLDQADLAATPTADFNAAGYAVVLVDARGSGASFGRRTVEWSPDEIADYGEIVDWIVDQPWSDGRVGAWGVSYDGNTAELLTTTGRAAVKAVAPQYSDFDPLFALAMPGGVFNDWFIKTWSAFNQALDADDICGMAAALKAPCWLVKLFAGTGVGAVSDQATLARAVAGHDNLDVYDALSRIDFRDDTLDDSAITLSDVSPCCGQRAAIEASDVPLDIWIGWLDAGTVDGALSRFLTFPNPQRVIIGPWSHGGEFDADPFSPPDTSLVMPPEEQTARLLEFFDLHVKSAAPAPPVHEIRYYTQGAGTWQTTTVWPPDGVAPQTWYFGADGGLTATPPTDEQGADTYEVDYTATTGSATRWHTQMGGDIVYPDRAAEDTKLLTYTTAPFARDVEVTGTPVVTLYVTSTATDGAFFAYLEDVAPDGRVTYLTEGQLRALHRREADDPPYVPLGPYHSYLRRDAEPLVPGEMTEIRLGLYATSVLIREGHSLRVALAGHDASVFARYPASGTPVLTVERNGVHASRVEVPVRATTP